MSVSYGGDSITFADGSVQSRTPSGRKNLIINGAMQVAQRGNNFTSVTTSRKYIADRFWYETGGMDQLTLTIDRVEDAPSNTPFRHSGKVTVTTAESAIVSGEYAQINYFLEQSHGKELLWGTSAAKSVTFSFWVKSSLVGNYPFTVCSAVGYRTYGTTYSISQANTWEKKIITIPGDTSYPVYWNLNAENGGRGIELRWGFNDSTSTLVNSGDQWTGTGATTYIGFKQSNCAMATTVGTTWQITGVQMEVGSTATDFEWLPIEDELRRCYRYCYRAVALSTYAPIGVGRAWSTSAGNAPFPLPVPMFTNPSVSYSALSDFDIVTVGAPTSIHNDGSWNNHVKVGWQKSGVSAGTLYQLELGNNTTGWIQFDGEL